MSEGTFGEKCERVILSYIYACDPSIPLNEHHIGHVIDDLLAQEQQISEDGSRANHAEPNATGSGEIAHSASSPLLAQEQPQAKGKGLWWCCSADFGHHDPDCPNYKPEQPQAGGGEKNLSGGAELKDSYHGGSSPDITKKATSAPPTQSTGTAQEPKVELKFYVKEIEIVVVLSRQSALELNTWLSAKVLNPNPPQPAEGLEAIAKQVAKEYATNSPKYDYVEDAILEGIRRAVEPLQDTIAFKTIAYNVLQKEVQELREKLRSYERMATTGVWVKTEKYAALVDQCKSLTARLELATKDVERLDWLSINSRNNQGLAVGGYWHRSDIRWQEDRLRAAIDAARTGQSSEGAK